MKGRIALVLMCTLLLPVFSFAQSPGLVITEIAAHETSDREWIEIYNSSVSPIDMNGYKFLEHEVNHGLTLYHGADMILEPGEYALICNDCEELMQTYPQSTSLTLLDSSWGSLNESGEYIAIINSEGTEIEGFTYPSAPDYSLQRLNPLLGDYSFSNWHELELHSMGEAISLSPEPPTTSDGMLLIDHTMLPTPEAIPMNMVLVLTQVPEAFDPNNEFTPYNFMLYYLDEYDTTLSVHAYLENLASSFAQPESEDIPEPTQPEEEDTPEETQESDTEPEEQTPPTEQETPTEEEQEELPEDSSTLEISTDENLTEFEQSCIAWWENHMTVSE